MTKPRPHDPLARPIERLFRRGTLAGLDEGQLLDRFVADRDELAFAGLVERLGPMVAGVCRRRLSDPHDVDDAFQATFLVLARKAGSIRDPRLVGNWLFGVAARVATRARAQAVRRKGREGPWVEVADKDQPADDGLRAALDDEIARLPEKYRRPIVLCYLEGLTHDEAAERLRCPVGTVRSRMALARDRLRSRLTRRGVAVNSGLAVASEGSALSPPVPLALIESTVRLASLSPGLLARNVSAHVLGLTQGVTRAMTFASLRTTAVLSATLALGAGGLVSARQIIGPPSGPGENPPSAAPAARASLADGPPGAEPAAGPGAATAGIAPPSALPPAADASHAGGPGTAGPVGSPALIGPPSAGGMPGMPGAGGFVGMPGTNPLSSRVMNLGSLIATMSPKKDRISVYSEQTGGWDHYRAPEGTTVTPLASGSLIAMMVKGDRITQVAALSDRGGRWRPQTLRAPASGTLQPLVGPSIAVYAVDGQVLAYSAEADRWDVLDVPSGTKARPVVSLQTAIVEQGDRLSVFGAKTGKWESIDLGKP